MWSFSVFADQLVPRETANDFGLYTIHNTQSIHVYQSSMAEGVATDSNLPLFSAEEVQQHNTEKDAWIIHRGKVYDVSEFLERHPGGKDILLAYAGQDVTVLMIQEELHKHTTFAYGWLGKYLIGRLKDDVSIALKLFGAISEFARSKELAPKRSLF